MTMWAAVYCRRSVDPGDKGVSVSVQAMNGRKYAQRRWPDLPVHVYTDNDLSAANPDVTRPAYQQLLDDVRAGNVAHVVVREQSRLTRQPSEWEALCVALQLAGIEEIHQTTGGLISVAEGSRLSGRIMAVVDAEYVEQVKVKVRSALLANADAGRPHGRPGYGYRMTVGDDGRPAVEPDPEQVPIVRRMVAGVAAGVSLSMVARGLNAEQVPTQRGGRWTAGSVRLVVTSQRIIGKRVHRGRVLPARWEPIVARAVWERAQARLGHSRPGTTASSRRKYLLTGGLVACAQCGTPLISSTTLVRGVREPSYQCPHPSRAEHGCGKCSILADRLEGHVVGLITERLRDPGILAAINEQVLAGSVDTTPIHAELERVEAKMADLAVRWANDDVIEVEYAAERRALHERRDGLLGQLARTPVEKVTLARLLAAWEHGGAGRRAVIPVLVETPVRVAGAFRDGRRLPVAERITVIPRWEESGD